MTQLTSTGRDYAPSWSADGSQIIFASERHGQFEILVMNAEACGKNYKGGFMLYDVTNPLKPVKLAEGWGVMERHDVLW